MNLDLKNNVSTVPSILPIAATANATGVAVALAGFESAVANLTATTASVGGTVKLTECATVDGTYTDVAVLDTIVTAGKTYVLTTGIAIVEDATVSIGYIGVLGFIKVVFIHSADGVVSGDVVLGHPHLSPVGTN